MKLTLEQVREIIDHVEHVAENQAWPQEEVPERVCALFDGALEMSSFYRTLASLPRYRRAGPLEKSTGLRELMYGQTGEPYRSAAEAEAAGIRLEE